MCDKNIINLREQQENFEMLKETQIMDIIVESWWEHSQK